VTQFIFGFTVVSFSVPSFDRIPFTLGYSVTLGFSCGASDSLFRRSSMFRGFLNCAKLSASAKSAAF
jgi:hypothetical protein